MAKKRSAHGSGSLRQRTDGRWEARFTYQDDLGQTRRGSVYGATQKECQRKLTAALAQADKGVYKRTPRYTVAEWEREWLDTYSDTWKPLTANQYRERIERYVLPNLGNVQLSALTTMSVQRWINKLAGGYKGQAPLAPRTIRSIHGMFHSSLEQAVFSGVIPFNPADNVKLPRPDAPAIRPLMDDDVPKFLEAARGDRFEKLFVVDLFTGLRQSEILGLEWQDVDFAAGAITVCRQLQRVSGGGYRLLEKTKNGKARTVPIPPGISDVLQAQKLQQAKWQLAAGPAWSNPHDLVFTDEAGGHLKHITVISHCKKIFARAGLDGARFHDLRHACAIMALQSGCNVKSVQEMLGHYSSAFTLDVYGAVSNAMRDDTRDRMEVLFDAASGGGK